MNEKSNDFDLSLILLYDFEPQANLIFISGRCAKICFICFFQRFPGAAHKRALYNQIDIIQTQMSFEFDFFLAKQLLSNSQMHAKSETSSKQH